MSNAAASQCSSGVESGWTLYLDDDGQDESSFSAGRSRRIPGSQRSGRSRKVEGSGGDDDDDDENLSMVSDASSGPPYYEVEDWRCHASGGGRLVACSERTGNRKKSKMQQGRGRHLHYEDTACSRQENFSLPGSHAPSRHANFNFPQGYPIANLEGNSECGKQYQYLQSSGAEKAASRKSSHSRKLM